MMAESPYKPPTFFIALFCCLVVSPACTKGGGDKPGDSGKKALLIILDGWGIGEAGMGNALANASTPYIDQLYANYPHSQLQASGGYVIFPKEKVVNTLGESVSRAGLKQLHIAETEKYAHVTFFINGGREEPFEGEDRILVNSPQVATYDLKPEMAAYEVKDKLVEALKTGKYPFVVANFANADMVGHTGVYTAIEAAVKVIDECLSEVVETATQMGYETFITADHGNAEHALNADDTPNTAHTTSPVPFIYVTQRGSATVQDGSLSDVAPSILHILGLEQPVEMTGKCLIKE